MANPARAYLATQVETTTQGELLLMLYEAAIKFLKRAKIEIDNKDFAKKGIYISKAMAIIHELGESLNKEKGGEITPKLSSLYHFCSSQLVKANIRLDKKIIDDVINILDGIRSAYAQIVPQMEGRGAPAGAPAQAATPPVPPAPAPTPQALKPQVAPTAPTAPVAPAETPKAVEPPTSAPPAQPAQSAETQPKPVPQQATAPPKLRTAYNAAKFRAANAYTTNNS